MNSYSMKGGEKLKNGQEVFINYGYIQQNEFPHDLPWYWRMKAKADIELEETEKKNFRREKEQKEEVPRVRSQIKCA